MRKTIIFISGWAVPKLLAQSKYVWDDPFWNGYNRIYISSKTPTSDNMVQKELNELCSLVNSFPGVIVAGHSLGAWWAANLACHPQSKIKKLVFWTPLGNTSFYPIFNVTMLHHPMNKAPNVHNMGPANVLTVDAREDLIVQPYHHSIPLNRHFKSTMYSLNGGHFFQTNHKSGLRYMRDWLELS